ncbi:MAG: component of SufBCD complex [Rhodobacteraceae bacterium]|nr:component of SufBCD complex [Paracoccaceae bacterium]
MDWYAIVFELIDMRSFSNLWYWIALAVVWSTTSHWVMGVPWDMVHRAQKFGGQAEEDLEHLVRINCNRLLYIAGMSGLWMLGLISGFLTSLAILAFWYWVEFAQAVFLLAFPMSFVGLLSLNSARIIRDTELQGEKLRRRLMRHRITTQVIGMVSIFITALWGMYQNLSLGVLGG